MIRAHPEVEYIGEIAFQLRAMALAADAVIVAHLLEMVSLECLTIQTAKLSERCSARLPVRVA